MFEKNRYIWQHKVAVAQATGLVLRVKIFYLWDNLDHFTHHNRLLEEEIPIQHQSQYSFPTRSQDMSALQHRRSSD